MRAKTNTKTCVPQQWSRFDGAVDLVDLLGLLPAELRHAIYRNAGLLTQHLHGELQQPYSNSTLSLIVSDAFQNNFIHRVKPLGLARHRLTFEPLFIHTAEMADVGSKLSWHPGMTYSTLYHLLNQDTIDALSSFVYL
eukprot:jgi/Hompol1/3371/HPOL_006494-RA